VQDPDAGLSVYIVIEIIRSILFLFSYNVLISETVSALAFP
jgi:hypothetical protein